MKDQFSLNIKTPCNQDFNSFSSTPNGGFCDSCEKEVIDFTKMNAEEITNHFSTKNTQNTCGRFKSHQLNPKITQIQQRKRVSFLSGIGLACLSLFAMTAEAQDITKQMETIGNTTEVKTLKVDQKIVVKGNVSEGYQPFPGVNIILEGSTIGTQTDFDGNFEFPEKLKKGDVLVFSAIGMTSQKIVISDTNSASNIDLKVNMKMNSTILMGKVAVKQVYKSNRK